MEELKRHSDFAIARMMLERNLDLHLVLLSRLHVLQVYRHLIPSHALIEGVRIA